MARIEIKVTLKSDYSFEIPSYRSAYQTDTKHIYTMTDEDGNIYVWKTTSVLQKVTVVDDEEKCERVVPGSAFKIKATVKGQTEYKGQPQTEISRVVVTEIESIPMTPEQYRAKVSKEREERIEAKREEQIKSVKDGDEVITMPYKQYKEHYSDCETVAGSFRRMKNGSSYIDVIVRGGRMKASGVRGKRFEYVQICYSENGEEKFFMYKAICEENAVKRFHKEFPEAKIIDVVEF